MNARIYLYVCIYAKYLYNHKCVYICKFYEGMFYLSMSIWMYIWLYINVYVHLHYKCTCISLNVYCCACTLVVCIHVCTKQTLQYYCCFFFQDAMVELGEEDDVKDDDDGDEYVIETELVEDEVILAMQMWLLLCSLAF